MELEIQMKMFFKYIENLVRNIWKKYDSDFLFVKHVYSSAFLKLKEVMLQKFLIVGCRGFYLVEKLCPAVWEAVTH